jgi:hypothetical protein
VRFDRRLDDRRCHDGALLQPFDRWPGQDIDQRCGYGEERRQVSIGLTLGLKVPFGLERRG